MSTDVAAVPPIIRHPYRFVAALEGLVLVVYLAAGTVAQVVGQPGLWLYAAANIALTLVVAVILTVMVERRSASAHAGLPGASAASWVGQRSRLTLATRAVKRQTG